MASSQAKIGKKRQRKRETNNSHFVPFLPDGLEKIPKKKQRNFKELKNTIMASFLAKIRRQRMRNRENKNYRSVTFLPDGLEKIPKKQLKNLKITLWQHFKPKQVGKG